MANLFKDGDEYFYSVLMSVMYISFLLFSLIHDHSFSLGFKCPCDLCCSHGQVVAEPVWVVMVLFMLTMFTLVNSMEDQLHITTAMVSRYFHKLEISLCKVQKQRYQL